MIEPKMFQIVLISALPIYYFLVDRPKKIHHDAQVAREFCPNHVRTFMKCFQGKQLEQCEKEMLLLHNCVYKEKGFNQTDMDFL